MSSAFGKTLHFITNVKLAELEKQRRRYTDHHQSVKTEVAQAGDDSSRRLDVLVDGMKGWPGSWSPDARPYDLGQFVGHARAMSGFPQAIVESWASAAEAQLLHEGVRFEFASLFGRLLTEWLESMGCEDALWDDFAPGLYAAAA